MAKTSARRKSGTAEKLAPPENNKIDLTKFKPDLSPNDVKNLLTPVKVADLAAILFPTIETISPVKTIGIGRTNLTVVKSTVFQTDATTPHASFDPPVGSSIQKPTVSVHFEPGRYGLAGNSQFVMAFSIEVFGTATFSVGSNVSASNASGLGTRTVSGRQVVSIVFNDTTSTPEIFGHIMQTGGARWNWFQTRISFLPLVIQA